jgi:hypothetical protein
MLTSFGRHLGRPRFRLAAPGVVLAALAFPFPARAGSPAEPPQASEATAATVSPSPTAGATRFAVGVGATSDRLGSVATVDTNGRLGDGGASVYAFGVSLFAELGDSEEKGFLSPLVRLTATRASTQESAPSVPSGSFTWLTLAADLCPIRASIAPSLWIRPCLRGTAGLLDMSAAPYCGNGLSQRCTTAGTSAQRPWAAAGLLARLQWRPVRRLLLEAQAGGSYVFTHDYASTSEGPVLAVSSLEPFAGVAAGVNFE